MLGITQVEDEAKKIQYRKFADTFYESCIEAWVKTETSIASESWSWVPQNDALEKKLIKLFEPNLKPSKKTKAKTSPEKRATEKKKTLNRSFNVDYSIYDLRPGIYTHIFI